MKTRSPLKADEMASLIKNRAKTLGSVLRTLEFDGLEVRFICVEGIVDRLRIGGVSADNKLVYIDVPVSMMPEDARANG